MAKAAKTTTGKNRQTIGTSVASTVVNSSGAPSRNTKPVRRKNATGGMLDAATANHRSGIQERMGAQLHPTAVLYAANAAEASNVQRNTRIVPSAVGYKDNFWAKRSEA